MSQDENRRSHLRYNPDKNSLISIFPDSRSEESKLVGLVRDVSEGGCAAVFHSEYFQYGIGHTLNVQGDGLDEQEATVVWKKDLDKQFVKVGFEFE